MKAIIERIRAAKTWQERAAIAVNEHPETKFNSFFERADRAMQFAEQGHIKNAQHECMLLGAGLADTIKKRDPQTLHDMARALAQWRRHEQTAKPEYLLMVLVSMGGMFPRGWEKTWEKHRGRYVAGFRKPPRGKSANLRTNDIIKNLRTIDPDFDENKLGSYRKQIRDYAKQLHITLDGYKFKPKTKVRTYPPKKAG